MSEHSKGPWFVRQSRYNEDQWYIELGEGSGCRGNEYMSVGGICTEADARLMGAAPELLEALRRCRFDSLNMSFADMEFIRAAYAKATGEAP